MVAISCHDLEAAGDADGVADSAGRHALDDGGDLGVHFLLAHPAEITALERGLGLAELRGRHRERRAGAELADHLLDEAPRIGLGRRVVHRDEDFGDQEFRLPHPGAGGLDRLLHLLFPRGGGGAELLAQQPAPADLGADLVVEHARLDAHAGKLVAQRPGGQVVAPLQLLHGLGHIGIGHGDAAALHLLLAQALIYQQARHLRAEAVQHLRRHRDAGIQGEEAGAADDIGLAHHLAIHHGNDPVRLGRGLGGGRKLRPGRQGQAEQGGEDQGRPAGAEGLAGHGREA
jgi:hypothetical protein